MRRRPPRHLCGPVLVLLMLSGCAGVGDVAPEAAGLGAGAGAGVLTANPLVGVAVAIGARYATAEGVDWIRAKQRRRVETAIAEAAGEAVPEATVPWVTHPDLVFDTLFGSVEGHAQVVREFGGQIRCREVMYTVAGHAGGVEGTADEAEADIAGNAPAPVASVAPEDWPEVGVDPVMVAAICRGAHGWRWAVSQPASQPSF